MRNILTTLALLLSAGASAQLPSYLPSTGLVAWWPFTGNSIDSTGFGHDGIPSPTAPTLAKGRYGTPNTAYQFNGTSNYFYVPPGTLVQERSVDITNSLTISAWVKSYNYYYSTQYQIYWRGDNTSAHDPHMLYMNGGQVRIRRDVDPGSTVHEVGYSLATIDTNYHLFTGTYDSATSIMRIYFDGVLKNQAYLPGTQTYPTSTMYNYIGAVDGGTWQFLYGFLDELAIWRRALTPCEVLGLFYSMPIGVTITQQPVHDTVVSGGVATFSVTATAPAANYQWQVNTGSGFTNLAAGTPYFGVTTPILTINPVDTTFSGRMYRCVVSADTCFTRISDSAKLTVTKPTTPPHTGVLPMSGVSSFNIAPNPNSGSFTISGDVPAGEIVSLEVANVVGQILYREKVMSVNGLVNKQVVLNPGIANGTYLLRVQTGQSKEVFRIVLEK